MLHLIMEHTQKEISLDLTSVKSLSCFSFSHHIARHLCKLSPLDYLSLLLSPLRFDIDSVTLSELHIFLKLLVASMLMNVMDFSLLNYFITAFDIVDHFFLCVSSLCFCDTPMAALFSLLHSVSITEICNTQDFVVGALFSSLFCPEFIYLYTVYTYLCQ